MTIYCEIVTQDKIVYKGDADIVILPGINGIMGILPNHAPLLSMLQMGIITIRKADINQFFTVAGGVVEIQPDQVTVLADMAENVEEIKFWYADLSESDNIEWKNDWNEENSSNAMPLAVQLKITWDDGETEQWLRRTAGSGIDESFGKRKKISTESMR